MITVPTYTLLEGTPEHLWLDDLVFTLLGDDEIGYSVFQGMLARNNEYMVLPELTDAIAEGMMTEQEVHFLAEIPMMLQAGFESRAAARDFAVWFAMDNPEDPAPSSWEQTP